MSSSTLHFPAVQLYFLKLSLYCCQLSKNFHILNWLLVNITCISSSTMLCISPYISLITGLALFSLINRTKSNLASNPLTHGKRVIKFLSEREGSIIPQPSVCVKGNSCV